MSNFYKKIKERAVVIANLRQAAEQHLWPLADELRLALLRRFESEDSAVVLKSMVLNGDDKTVVERALLRKGLTCEIELIFDADGKTVFTVQIPIEIIPIDGAFTVHAGGYRSVVTFNHHFDQASIDKAAETIETAFRFKIDSMF